MKIVRYFKRLCSRTSSQVVPLAEEGEELVDAMEELSNLAARFDKFEWLQKDMQKEMWQLHQDVRELKSVQISLAMGTNQQLVRVIEHQALLLADISWLL